MLVKIYVKDINERPIYYTNINEVMAGDHHIRMIDDNDKEIIIRHREIDYHFITVSMEE